MHGNEVVGKEMVLYFLVDLCTEYKRGGKEAKFLISETRIHILPSMNPDGWQAAYSEIQVRKVLFPYFFSINLKYRAIYNIIPV